MIRRAAILVLLLVPGQVRTQDLVNGDLEGTFTGPTVVPPGWQAVPLGDPACFATQPFGATPDLTGPTGPVAGSGIMGNPFSGSTFVSGLWFAEFHEGIMQTVTGLTPGCAYTIGLRQTVVKQINADALDTSGSWALYADAQLLGITAPTVSLRPAISLDMPWEARTVTFTASASAHTLKFMPADDDSDQLTDGLRMGIDSVHVRNALPVVPVSVLGNDTTLCPGSSLVLSTGLVGDHLWQDGSSGTIFPVNSAGVYWVRVTQGCNVVVDSIRVFYTDLPPVHLGPDLALCTGEQAVLRAPSTGTPLWQDGSTADTLLVQEAGTYWVRITAGTCGTSDTVLVAYRTCGIELDLPNVFSPNGDGSNERFVPIRREGIRSMRTTIYGRWGAAVFSTSDPDINWKGVSEGEHVPEGTYFYVVEFVDAAGHSGVRRGSVTVLR